jgi:RNA polymerase sigma-70 factor (ECF subfamily)
MFSRHDRSCGVRTFTLVAQPPTPPRDDARFDRASWDQIIRQHDHRVMLSVLALGLRPDRARDIVQAAWMRLIEKDHDGALLTAEFPALAITQARFLGLDELRRQVKETQQQNGVSEAADAQTTCADAERALLSREQLARASAVLAELPPSTQRLFRLLYAEPPMPYAQAAAELGLSLQRTRQIMCEARKKLRLAIEDDQ